MTLGQRQLLAIAGMSVISYYASLLSGFSAPVPIMAAILFGPVMTGGLILAKYLLDEFDENK